MYPSSRNQNSTLKVVNVITNNKKGRQEVETKDDRLTASTKQNKY